MSCLLFLFLLSGSSLTRLRTLRSVFRTALCTASHTGSIKRAAHNVITHTREILHTASAHHNDRVLLQVMTLSRYIGVDLL